MALTPAERRAAASARMKARHADPEFKAANRARMEAYNARPEVKAASSARMKALNANAEFKAASSARMKAFHARPEVKAAKSARMKAFHARPEVKAAFSARMEELHGDPTFAAAFSRAAEKRTRWLNDPEICARARTHRLATRLGAHGVEIPKWVKQEYWVEFLEWASLYGEEAAASHVRALKEAEGAEIDAWPRSARQRQRKIISKRATYWLEPPEFAI